MLNWLTLAMVHHRLGQSDDAHAWLDKAVHEHDWLACAVLRREAEELLSNPSKPARP